jgi:murein tripeptide amidase MpaA
MISISTSVASGSIDVLDAAKASDIRLALRQDPNGVFLGWFHFRLSGARGTPCRFNIVNAGDILSWRLANREEYEHGWQNTGPMVSYDGATWFRIPGMFEGTTFSFELTPEHDICYFATWAPYGVEREQAAIARAQMSPLVKLETLGNSVEGRPIDLLTVGEQGPGKKTCWIIARQHPSETQGGYFIEGVLDRLLDQSDAVSRALLKSAVVHIVPNVNPDGSAKGLTRSNARGANLNREWVSPSLENSPEVFHVRKKMEETGLDFCIDCHADKELRCNFIWPSENVPTWTPGRREIFEVFENAWAQASPDYELGHPYPGGCPEVADLSMAWNWIGNRFPHALSILLEQPFQDVTRHSVPETGWAPERAYRFGRSFLEALNVTVGRMG